jgi:hypothetical protein
MIDGQQEKSETEAEDQICPDWLLAYPDYFDSFNNGNEKDGKQLEESWARRWERDENEEPCGRRGTARVFMKGMTGDEENLPYRDQVDVVAGFVEQAMYKGCEKPVALLDDRKSGDRMPLKQKDFRPRRWILTIKELRAELSKPVTDMLHLFTFRTCTDVLNSASKLVRLKKILLKALKMKHAMRRGGFCKLYHKALLYVLSDRSNSYRFLPDLIPSTMEVVLATAPRTHALALKNFFYKYLTSKAAIGVTIPVRLRAKYSTHLPKTNHNHV